MGSRHLLFVPLLATLVASTSGSAQSGRLASPVKRQLIGLDKTEAEALLAKLAQAQDALRGGRSQHFDLSAGSIASYDATNVSPRSAFLAIPLNDIWEIQRDHDAGAARREYRFAYAPDGLGRRYWDMRVTLSVDGAIERVRLMYLPPAPF